MSRALSFFTIYRLASAGSLRGRRGNLGFGFGDNAQRFGVGVFAVTGVFPFLLAAIKLLFGARHIYLFRLQRIVGQDRHTIRQDFNETPVHVVTLPVLFAAVHDDIARAQQRHQGGMPVQRL